MRGTKPALPFIFITLVLDILGIGLLIPIIPKLVEQFEGSVASASHSVGFLWAVYALMQFLFAPLLGSLSDRFGRRPVILISLFGSGIDYFLMAFAPNLAWFYVGRIISGISGANMTAATAYIADISPPEKRAANFGLVGAAFGLGFILGPALGGFLGGYGIKVPFFVAGGLTLLNWLYGWFFLPESLPLQHRRRFSWVRSNPLGSLLELRKHAEVFGLVGIYFLFYLAHQVLPSCWVLYTGYRYGWDVKETGISLAIVGLTAAVVQGVVTRLVVARLGERKTLVLGLFFSAIGYIGYGMATQGWMIYWVLLIGAIGGITSPAVQGLASRSVGPDEQGGIQGALSSVSSVSGIVGPPIATALFSYFIHPSRTVTVPGAAFYFSALLTIVAMFWSLHAVKKWKRANPVKP
jgi:DHA1 family tetracycline resistance protein-like MFS transporter